MLVLIVDDDPKDLRRAVNIARSAGFGHIETQNSFPSAMESLQKGLQGEQPLPDAIVLDLDLGFDSGYELLRFWHTTPGLSAVHMIIWSCLGEENREICALFHADGYVGKWERDAALGQALAGIEFPQITFHPEPTADPGLSPAVNIKKIVD